LFFGNTLDSINEIFSLIGTPLFHNVTGGDAATQQRAIGVADLHKVAEVENKRGEIATKLSETVILQAVDFDQIRCEFEVYLHLAIHHHKPTNAVLD
jgi:hypothetical protein